MKTVTLIVILAGCLLLSGCVFVKFKDSGFKTYRQVAGNGVTAEKSFGVGSFSRLDLFVPADVEYTISDECALTVRMDENLIDSLTVSVEDGTLKIGSTFPLKNFKKLEIRLSSPSLERLYCRGAVDFDAEGTLRGEEFSLQADGAADVNIRNLDVKKADFLVNGAADLNVCLADAESVSVIINGAGDIDLSGKTQKVFVTANGAGDVDLTRLDYETLSKEVHGVGSVKTGKKKI